VVGGLLLGGGGITSVGSSLVLNSVVFSNNAGRGLDYTLSASNVMATNCLFIGNFNGAQPPVSVSGDSVFSDTTFAGNQAWFGDGVGGGIAVGYLPGPTGDNLTLLNCNITNNYADWSSGGIYFNGNNLIISNCVINNNRSSERYGGIYASATNILIFNSSISGNSAYDNFNNGAIALYAWSNICVSGCTVSSNQSGAGIAHGGPLYLTNCTVSGNRGAGIENYGMVQAVNCTIAFNDAGVDNTGGGTFYALNTLIAKNGTDFSGTLTSQGFNLIGDLGTNMTVIGATNGNIYGVDPLLGPLQNNGGPTLTHALMRGSPAINAGNKDGAPLTDERGVARPYGDGVDIGAFESEYNVLRFTDISRVNATDIHLQLAGLPGSVCTIQASSNFLDWENVFASDNGPAGILEFVDQNAANHSNRFYRALTDEYSP
jgi:hypothetical protein